MSPRRRVLALAVAWFIALTGTVIVLAPTPAVAVPDRDCGDFSTQAAAQNFFLDQGGPQSDPHGLDAEGDGVACESNPCPCSNYQGGGGGGAEPSPDPVKKQRARIIRVIDGDTVEVKLASGPRVDVRLIGIDTPEVYGGVECGGQAASASAKKILPVGTRVLLVSDPSQDLKDRYGRLLRYVMKSSLDVNRTQIKRGHATVYVYNNNPFRRVAPYRDAETFAKNHNAGIWKNCR